MMRKTTTYHYAEGDVRQIVRDELGKAKPSWIEDITRNITRSLGGKFDKVMALLDKVMGELKTIR